VLAALAFVGAVASLAAPPARAEMTREAAMADLDKKDDVVARRDAVAWLAEHGAMPDVPRLAERLRDADAGVRALAEAALWEVWGRSGDEAVDQLLRIGIAQMGERDIAGAVETFSDVIARRPDFAEGWNKRATVYFMLGQYEKSLADCDEVMKRNPYHFGALAGYGQIYFQMKEYDKAIEYWKRALKVNPNMVGVEGNIEIAEKLLAERRKRSA